MRVGNHPPGERLPRPLRGVVPVEVGSRVGSEARSKGGEKCSGIKAWEADLDLVQLASGWFPVFCEPRRRRTSIDLFS
jgi:hypothetical protein